MNILIVANKSDTKDYIKLLKNAPNTTVLGAINYINADSIKNIKSKYNPHSIIMDSSVKHKGIDITIVIKLLQKSFPCAKIMLFARNEERELFDDLNLFAVIYDTITDLQFNELVNGLNNNSEIDVNSILLQNQSHKVEVVPKSYGNILNLRLIIAAVIIIFFVILLATVLAECGDSQGATPDEASSSHYFSSELTIHSSSESSTTINSLSRSSIIQTADTSYTDKYQQAVGSRFITTTTTVVNTTEPTTIRATTKKVPSTTKVIKIASSDDSNDNYNNNGGGSQKNYVSKKEEATKKQKMTVTKSKVTVDYNNNNWSNDKKEQTQITLSYRSKTLEVADSFTLTATVTPKNKKVKWTTSNEKIAKIKSTGYVKAVSIGTVTITATVDGQSASCTVHVIDRQ